MSEHEPTAPLEEGEDEVNAHVLKEALAAGAVSAALFAGSAAAAPQQFANPDGGAGAAQNVDPGPGAAGGGQNVDPGPGAAGGGQNVDPGPGAAGGGQNVDPGTGAGLAQQQPRQDITRRHAPAAKKKHR
jgi:hypothetical protein